jgi:hypothetical protein
MVCGQDQASNGSFWNTTKSIMQVPMCGRLNMQTATIQTTTRKEVRTITTNKDLGIHQEMDTEAIAKAMNVIASLSPEAVAEAAKVAERMLKSEATAAAGRVSLGLEE